MMTKKPGRPSGAGKGVSRKTPADWDDRPVKAYKPSRKAAEEYDGPEDEFYEAKPARPKAGSSRPAKARGAHLPFGDDGYPAGRKAPSYASDPYGERPARKAQGYDDRPLPKSRYGDERPARRPLDEEYPVRSARLYDEELPVRKKPRAQSPRPAQRAAAYRDDYVEYDRPVRKNRTARGRKKNTGGSALITWGIAIILALLIGFGVRTFGFELITVRGDAMRGTLMEGGITLVKKAVYYTEKPARGDIVAVNSPEGKLIRRVVALPGETIEIKGGVTYVNDEPLDEPYVYQAAEGDYPLTTIQEGCYFVMCDNRLNFDDSRTLGLFKNTRSLIVGKVDQIVWPLSDWGSIQ
jgi:signal peptidase I